MKTKLFITLLAAILLCLALAACGAVQDTEGGDSSGIVDSIDKNENEQKPNDSEQKPNDSEQKPDDSEQKPDDSEQKPDDGEQKPNDSEQKPDDGEQKPDDGEHEHVFGQWVVTLEPTCKVKGARERYCTCGEKQAEQLGTIPHTEVINPAVPETCLGTGLTEGSYCGVCGDVIKAQQEIPAKEHSYNNDIEVIAPTAKDDGYTKRICVCGEFIKTDIIPATGSIGLAYSINSDGKTCTITGRGDCRDNDIVIPVQIDGYKVTAIGDDAFFGDRSLITVRIPKGVVGIGSSVFGFCENLTSVELPEGLQSIGVGAFQLTALKSITIPESMTVIPEYLADSCYSLESLSLPAGVTHIGTQAFSGCRSLTRIEFGDKLEYIGNGAFICCGLTSLELPASVTHIGDGAFSELGSLKEITIPEGVTYLGSRAFEKCPYLEKIYYNAVLVSNTSAVFSRSGHSGNGVDLYIGATVEKIPEYLFAYMYDQEVYALKSVIFESGSRCTEIGAHAFEDARSITEITIPENIKTIGTNAFKNCYAVTTVYFNAVSMNDLEKNTEALDGLGAFTDGVTLKVGKQVTRIPSYLFCHFYIVGVDKLVSVEFASGGVCSEIAANAFMGCRGLTDIKLPNTVTSIGEYAFAKCDSLKTVELPTSITVIPERAFYYCEGLVTVTIAEPVVTIGSEAFDSCTMLETINFNAKALTTVDSYFSPFSASGFDIKDKTINIGAGVTVIPAYLFRGMKIKAVNFAEGSVCAVISEGAFVDSTLPHIALPDSVKTIGKSAFGGCFSLESIDLGNGVETIGNGAFRVCEKLTSISFPDSVISIGENACIECDALRSITFGKGLKTIGQLAFRDCFALEEIIFNAVAMNDFTANPYLFGATSRTSNGVTVTIGACVTRIPDYIFHNSGNSNFDDSKIIKVVFEQRSTCEYIGSYAFADCRDITEFVIPDSVRSLGKNVFSACRGLSSLTIGAGVEEIGDGLVAGCSALSKVELSEGIRTIGYGAFLGCDAIERIVIPNSVTSIGERAFYECDGLKEITIGAGVKTIGKNAFYNCKMLSKVYYNAVAADDLADKNYVFKLSGKSAGGLALVIGKDVKSIPAYLFYSASTSSSSNTSYYLASVTFEQGSVCESIGDCAFRSCSTLAGALGIPDSVKSIGKAAFSGAIITELTIGKGVENIAQSAFTECKYLTVINYNAANATIPSGSNYIFSYAGTKGTGIALTIGSSVKSIPAYMFNPVSVNSSYSPKIISVIFAEDSECESIGAFAFNYVGMIEIIIPDSVTFIGNNAFSNCAKLERVVLGSGLATISERVFVNCKALIEITIPKSVTEIKQAAFQSCTALVTVHYEGTEADWTAVTIGKNNEPIKNATLA